MHFFKAFVRNFYHNRLYTTINITGLAVGLAAFGFILMYILDETSFDKHHTGYEQIYRLESDITISGKQQYVAKTSFAIGPTLYREIPEIINFVRFRGIENCYLEARGNQFYETDLYYCDSSVFDVFTYEFLYGNPKTALREPYTMVLTESMALKYFGERNAINQTVSVNNNFNCTVTAIIRDPRSNTHLNFSGLISLQSMQAVHGETMYNNLNTIHFWALRLFTYIQLKDGGSIESVYRRFGPIHDKYIAPVSERMNGVYRLNTTRLDRIHLYNEHEWDLPKGNINTIYVLYAIAFLVLIIAGINYMNLATARSAQKAREVGIRKVLGAYRGQLARFYILDALMLSFLALIVSLMLMEFLLPLFNQLTRKSLDFEFAENGIILIALLLASLLIGFLSGLYPAYYLASFQPSGIFSRVVTRSASSGLLRKALITFQFAIASAMIAGALVIKLQVDYINKRDLGFKKENLLVVRATDSTFKKQIEAFNHSLLSIPDVVSVSTSNTLPGTANYLDIFLVEGEDGMEKQLMSLMYVSQDFVKTLGLKVIEGRNFRSDNETDKLQAAIINRAAANKLGWNENPIGRKIIRRGYERERFETIGVVEDLIFASLYEENGPIVFFLETQPGDLMSIRLQGDQPEPLIAQIEALWDRFNPHEPFKYDFLENLIDDLYAEEFNLNKVILSFAILSLFISLLGLYGLTSFVTERASKAIGIRKLLGAPIRILVVRLLKDFALLIVLALVVATPVAWVILEHWLDHFAYRIDLKVTWFLLSGIVVLLVSQASVLSLTVKAALANPADVVRYE